MKLFATHPDRVAAVAAQLERRRVDTARATRDLHAALCADELARCVAEGVTAWPEIKRRMAERCGGGR